MSSKNIGFVCTTLQCEVGLAQKTAMRWITAKREVHEYSFSDLDRLSNQFANVLKNLKIQGGDVIFTFLPKCPEQFFTFLGSLKRECITGTLFSNFGNDALLDRLGDSKASLVITTKAHFHKLKPLIPDLPALRYVILTDNSEHVSETVLSYSRLMSEAKDTFPIPNTSQDTPSVLHYTSGSTGKPKGVLHCHRSVLHQSLTCSGVLGLKKDDLFWCTADQGWVTGTSYGIIGPWSIGVTQLQFAGSFNPKEWMDLLESERVSVWYTAPTALRMLMRENDDLYTSYSLPELRSIFSVGEPLNPEVIAWGRRVFNTNIYDTWFQTETGGIMVANWPGQEIRPGSMGKPVEGISIAILGENGAEVATGEQGQLCGKAGWDAMFITYLNNDSAYRSKFKDGWYYSGDRVWCDNDGYYWFLGRDDDVINTSGHLVSPFEIESCLLEMSEIYESGVIGVPDDLLYEKIVAFIHLRDDLSLDSALELKIKSFVAKRLSSIAIPQEIVAVATVPKNKSGKIMRRYLKSQFLGLDSGDLSTLDND